MPIYEFECKACNHIFEDLIRGQEELKELRCPACNSTELQRLVSACGIMSSNPGGSGTEAGKNLPSACSTCVTKDCSTCK